ncbi:hypothetical protein Q4493_05315 [Colwellia sp. 1_MG-2023]|uniref:hypothetical protein n=1 Tax=Colwellia sp. 1_MG-2023 TaxID=3062649 RepID=UPI0026E259CF|nr:hypothetical protein [Colwellia sp. 1_MG-2023]MDO6445190.1 hypothetical protein [Colwellia sp. 1_MG-2023]
MNLKLTAIFASTCCLLLACNNQREDSQEVNKPIVKEEQTLSTEIEKSADKSVQNHKVNLKNKSFNADKELTDKTSKKTLLINGEKFIVHGLVLEKGTKVFSPSIQQVGIVKGSIVVVTSTFDIEQLTATYKISSISEIAANTFRLIPDDSEDLYRFYLSLKNSPEIKQAELSIDYSRYPPKAAS